MNILVHCSKKNFDVINYRQCDGTVQQEKITRPLISRSVWNILRYFMIPPMLWSSLKMAIYCPQGSDALRQQLLMMHWLCQSMPEHARVCQSMPEYARVCQSMQEYARVCQSMPEYARVCQSMPEYAKVCQSMPEYARVCQSMPEYARVCQSLAKFCLYITS